MPWKTMAPREPLWGKVEGLRRKEARPRNTVHIMGSCAGVKSQGAPCGHPEDSTFIVSDGYGKEASPKHVDLGLDPHGIAGHKVQVGQRQHREHHRGHTSSGSASDGSGAIMG